MRHEIKSHPVIYLLFLFAGLTVFSCTDGTKPTYTYDPTPWVAPIPTNYPPLRIPADNPITLEGIELGRRLFYDPVISHNKQYSCATCHRPDHAFSDTLDFSTDIEGELLEMNTMPLFNVGFYPRYSWNGSIPTIEDDVNVTIASLHGHWEGLIETLSGDDVYQRLFFEAFGQEEITSELIENSIAQFVRSLVSFQSKFDSIFAGLVVPTPEEMRGYELFFTEEGDCFHCHIDPLFTNLGFHNNALDNVENMNLGYELVTGTSLDRGKFKVPSLRNLAFTAPYMHDGRFKTLREVIDFYSEGLQQTPYADSNMKNVHKGGIRISEEDKQALIAFLLTLTDYQLVSNPQIAKP